MTPLAVARKALEIAEANPDHVYRQMIDPEGLGACAYVHLEDGVPEPGCLFGRAFLELGVDPDLLLSVNHKGIDWVLGYHPFDAPDLALAQTRQDDGEAWGSDDILEPLRRFIEQNS